MTGQYFLIIETVNKSGNYGVTIENKYKDAPIKNKHDAEQLFFDKMSSIGGNPQTDELRISLYNPIGNIERQDYIDNRVNSQPTVTTEDIVAKLIADGVITQKAIDDAKASLEEKAE